MTVSVLTAPVVDANPSLPAGDNRMMLVFVGFEDATGESVSTVAYGDQSLTLAVRRDFPDGTTATVEIWYATEAQLAVVVGDALVVTLSGAVDDQPANPVSAFLGGVKQSPPIVTTNFDESTSSNLNIFPHTVKEGDYTFAVALHATGLGSYTVLAGGYTKNLDTAGSTSQRAVFGKAHPAAGTGNGDVSFGGTPDHQVNVFAHVSFANARPEVDSAAAVPASGVLVDVQFDQSMTQDANFFLTSNYTIAGHTITGIAAPSSSVARLTLGEEMFQGSSLEVFVDGSLENAFGDTMQVAPARQAAFTGVGVPPKILTVVPPTSTSVRITFDEPMTDNGALRAAASYSLTSLDMGVAPLIISSVSPEVVTNPTYVDLNVNEQTLGASYRAKIESAGLLDVAGNAIDPAAPANEVDFTGTASLPEVATAVVLDGSIIRINFDKPMRKDALLGSIGSYLFTPVSAGAAQLFFDSVSVPDVAEPTFVEITVSEMTIGATYDITVNGPTDTGFNPINGAADTASFTGEGINPTISSIFAVSLTRVDIVFSEAMRNNPDINDPAKYAWDLGLVTLGVSEVTSAGVVKLVTSEQVPGILYTLTVTP